MPGAMVDRGSKGLDTHAFVHSSGRRSAVIVQIRASFARLQPETASRTGCLSSVVALIKNRTAFFPECGNPFGEFRGAGDCGSRERVDDAFLFLTFRRVDHHLRDFYRTLRPGRQAARQVFCSGESLASGHHRIDDPEAQCLTGGEHVPEYGHSADRLGSEPESQALCSRPAGRNPDPCLRLPDPNLFLRDPVVGACCEFQSPSECVTVKDGDDRYAQPRERIESVMAFADPFADERVGGQFAPCTDVAAGTEARASAKQDGRPCIAAFGLPTSILNPTDHFHVQGVSLLGPVQPEPSESVGNSQ